jgi:CyaY protein
MDEQEFVKQADATLARIEAALTAASEADDAAFEVETQPGGVIEIECANGSKIVINRHVAAREIWLAAKSGGYHFKPVGDTWLATRDGEDLLAAITRVLTEQTGKPVRF